ncbi:MAG: hypothetical protein HY053_05990 [Proteobacteria bacterium]|nr:hypothetical protein [Pseudomonadota bacterium]
MRLLGVDDDLSRVYFTGLEHSTYLQQVAAVLHPECKLAFQDGWKKWQKNLVAQKRLFLSRFVASYAMADTATLAQWLQPFDAFTVTDVFHLGEGDFHTWDLGLEMTFFDFSSLVEKMLAEGFMIFVTEMYPDHHAYKNQDCFVARLFGIKKEAAPAFQEKLKAYPQIEEFLQESALKPGDAQMYKNNLATRVTPARWEAIRAYKQEYPVWGETPDPLPAITGKPRQPGVPGANFVINHPQLADAINQALLRK